MPEEQYIDQWAQRRRRGAQIGTRPYHLVQSVIQDAVVTKCGRRMRDKAKSGTLIFKPNVLGFDRCLQCAAVSS